MATGASINISVPGTTVQNLKAAVTQMTRFNLQLQRAMAMHTAYLSTLQSGNVSMANLRKNLQSSAQAFTQYGSGANFASGASNQLSASTNRLAGYLRQTAVSLYVVGGAATAAARPLIGLSAVMNTWDQWNMAEKLPALDAYFKRMGKGFKRMGKWMKTQFSSMLGWLRRVSVGFRRWARQLPIVGTAIRAFKAKINSLNISMSVLAGYVATTLVVLGGLWWGLSKVAENFAPISEHIQRAISVSDLAQDEFNNLAKSILGIADALEVFTPEEIASMVERMAYAGAINEQFEETAKMIGQIAYVTDIEMAEITRDMARLTSQTGENFRDMANVILRTFAQASITYEETVEAFQQAGMLLREDLGVTIEQMGAIVVQLEKFGYTGTRAATALRSLAARSSELREGLRGSQEIFQDLGIEDLVSQFKEGEVGLMEFIKRTGEAGASYGHFVNIFNRRAGVAAAAVAEFAEEHEKATDMIEKDTQDIVKMYKELIATQQGLKEQVEAERALATQKWARNLQALNKSWLRVGEGAWKVAGILSYTLNILNSIVQLGLGVVAGAFYAAISPGKLFLMIIQGILDGVEKLAQLIPGISFDWDIGDIPVLSQLQTFINGVGNVAKGFFKGAWKSIAFWQQESFDVMQDQRDAQKRLEDAQKDQAKAIKDATDEFKEFKDALGSRFIEKLSNRIYRLSAELGGAGDMVERQTENIRETLRKSIFGEGTLDIGSMWDTVKDETLGLVGSLIKMREASTYVEDKFSDLRDELDDMFGLSREIQRRHGATVKETGEQIGEVQTGGTTSEQERMRERWPDAYKQAQKFMGRYEEISGTFFSTLSKKMNTLPERVEGWEGLSPVKKQEKIATAAESAMIDFMSQVLDIDVGNMRTGMKEVRNFYEEVRSRVKDQGLMGDIEEDFPQSVEDLATNDEAYKRLTQAHEKWGEDIEGYIKYLTETEIETPDDAKGKKGLLQRFYSRAKEILGLPWELPDWNPMKKIKNDVQSMLDAIFNWERWGLGGGVKVQAAELPERHHAGLSDYQETKFAQLQQAERTGNKEGWTPIQDFWNKLDDALDFDIPWGNWNPIKIVKNRINDALDNISWSWPDWKPLKTLKKKAENLTDVSWDWEWTPLSDLMDKAKNLINMDWRWPKWSPLKDLKDKANNLIKPEWRWPKWSPLKTVKNKIGDALDNINWGWPEWDPIGTVKSNISGALGDLSWSWPEWSPISTVKSKVQGALGDLELSWPGSLKLPKNPLGSVRDALNSIDGISIPSDPLKGAANWLSGIKNKTLPDSPLKDAINWLGNIDGLSLPRSPLDDAKKWLKNIKNKTLPDSPIKDAINWFKGISGVKLPDNPLPDIKSWFKGVGGVSLPDSPLKSVKKKLEDIGINPEKWNPVKWITNGVKSTIKGINWSFSDEFSPIGLVSSGVANAIDSINWSFGDLGDFTPAKWLGGRIKEGIGDFSLSFYNLDSFKPAQWLGSRIKGAISDFDWSFYDADNFKPFQWLGSRIKGAISDFDWSFYDADNFKPAQWLGSRIKEAIGNIDWPLNNIDEFNPAKIIANGITNAIENIDWVWPDDFAPIKYIKGQFKGLFGSEGGSEDKNKDSSTPLENLIRLLNPNKTVYAEEKQQPEPFKKLLESAKYIADASGRLDDAAEGIKTGAKATTNIERQVKNNIKITIDQAFDNNYDIDVEGTKGEVTEDTLRRAIEKATAKLEQKVRSSVDPEALESLVIEEIEDEIKGNPNGSEATGQEW